MILRIFPIEIRASLALKNLSDEIYAPNAPSNPIMDIGQERKTHAQRQKHTTQKPRGRPRTHPVPAPVPDTLENVASILMTTPPPKESE